MPAVDSIERFTALADLLIPGDADFPPLSHTRAPELALQRFSNRVGANGVRLLLELMPVPSADAIERLEGEEPVLFFELRFATYFAYYQQPEIIAVLQQLGHDYHAAPQPNGYTLDPFDARPGHDLPMTPRGSYKATDEIETIDISTLPWFQEAEAP